MRDSNKIILLRKITIHVHFETNTSVLFEDLGTIVQEQCSSYTLLFLTDDDFDNCHHYNNGWPHSLQIQVEAEKHVLCRHGKYTDEDNHVELGGLMSYCLDTFISYADQYKKCMYIIDFFLKIARKIMQLICVFKRDFTSSVITDINFNTIHCNRRTVCFFDKT